ncbi:MAG: FimB/Mfa2 family fimbrial subunit [Muribaculaceae bacterium]|nr:FimB/Mfa2 family fimbrial subunit [Muribaculaceae bacterium]
MKKYKFNRFASIAGKALFVFALAAGMSACDNQIYDFEDNCDPEVPQDTEKPDVKPEPEEPPVEPGKIRIYVRTNPGSGGTSQVAHVDNPENVASTSEGIYVSIDLEENENYTLTASETNPEYKFVRWHDDTNDGYLTEGLLEIQNIPATALTRYTAVFEKIEAPQEPEEPEPVELGQYYVRFVFDKNMQFTDGFKDKVKSVDLYVFNSSGSFIAKYHDEGAPLREEGYMMELNDLQPGEYEFIAWCGLANNGGHFTVPVDAQISRNDHVICTMATSSDATHQAFQNNNLSPLFHGRKQNAVYVEKNTDPQVHTVYLTKNTNNVNITLQHKDGLEFERNRFVVTMHDQNDVMRHDNEMHPAVQTVQYRPYRTVLGSTVSTQTRNSTVGNFLQVELSTARLMKGNNPIITVEDTESGKTVFSIPLIKWALQLRSSNYQGIEDQEYLDREDNYNLMLWLDSNKDDGWFGAEIEIKDWHVVDDSTNIP